MKKSSKIIAWIISDGTKGMENQSIALANLLNIDFRLINYKPPFLLNKFPLTGKFISPSIIKINLKSSVIPKYVITTGRRMSGISIAIKSFFGDKVKTIHIQDPKISNKNFDLLLIPEHDNVTGHNIIQTKGALSFFKNNEIEQNLNFLLTKPIIFLMVGGDNKRFIPNNTDYYDLSMKVVKATKLLSAKLIVSTSRRTSLKAKSIIKSVFTKQLNDCKFYNNNDKNPYPEVLKTANYIIVTSDSVNMISETATISTPLFVSYFPKETGKIYSFLENLLDLEIIKKFDGQLFNYKKNRLETNDKTILKINEFFRS